MSRALSMHLLRPCLLLACFAKPSSSVHVASTLEHVDVEGHLPEDEYSACTCLNWKKTYASGLVKCGHGKELTTLSHHSDLSHEQVFPFVHFETCVDFFERLDHNHCVNTDFHSDGTHSWCYVSSECSKVDRIFPVSGADLSWKACSVKEDTALGDHDPLQLFALAQKSQLNFGLLVKAAYPTELKLWEEVEQDWWLKTVSGVTGPKLYEVQLNGQGDKVITLGDQLWAVNEGSVQHLSTSFGLHCIQGCDHEVVASEEVNAVQREASGAFQVQSMDEAAGYQASVDCKCLNWKETYESGYVTCGNGLELVNLGHILGPSSEQLLPFFGHRLCTDFFHRLNNNYCVSSWQEGGARNHRSWCYVSAKCGLADDASKVQNHAVGQKSCDANEDTSLHNLAAWKLRELASTLQVDAAILSYVGAGRRLDTPAGIGWENSQWLGGWHSRKTQEALGQPSTRPHMLRAHVALTSAPVATRISLPVASRNPRRHEDYQLVPVVDLREPRRIKPVRGQQRQQPPVAWSSLLMLMILTILGCKKPSSQQQLQCVLRGKKQIGRKWQQQAQQHNPSHRCHYFPSAPLHPQPYPQLPVPVRQSTGVLVPRLACARATPPLQPPPSFPYFPRPTRYCTSRPRPPPSRLSWPCRRLSVEAPQGSVHPPWLWHRAQILQRAPSTATHPERRERLSTTLTHKAGPSIDCTEGQTLSSQMSVTKPLEMRLS